MQWRDTKTRIGAGLGLFALWAGVGMAEGLPVPPGAQAAWVAQQAVQNGVPVEIQRLELSGSVEDVLAYYRTRWADPVDSDAPGYIERQAGGWRIISRLEGDRQTVVQLRRMPQGGVEGFVSRADLSATPASNRATREFPRKSGTRLVSSTESPDGAGKATTIMLINRFSVAANVRFYQRQMGFRGWRVVHASQAEGTAVLLFNKPGKRCEIAVSHDRGRTVIMANLQEVSG
ncbi:MAG TPA: hypothetical protein ENJ79_10575 [Gammaproteobacteria bacterium]|nr:hypothetical protein [Gammaproteobacteria bacterium]